MNVQRNITRLQNLPESQRKIILWIIVIILGLALLFRWVYGLNTRFERLQGQAGAIQLPVVNIQEGVETLENIDLSPMQELVEQLNGQQ